METVTPTTTFQAAYLADEFRHVVMRLDGGMPVAVIEPSYTTTENPAYADPHGAKRAPELAAALNRIYGND